MPRGLHIQVPGRPSSTSKRKILLAVYQCLFFLIFKPTWTHLTQPLTSRRWRETRAHTMATEDTLHWESIVADFRDGRRRMHAFQRRLSDMRKRMKQAKKQATYEGSLDHLIKANAYLRVLEREVDKGFDNDRLASAERYLEDNCTVEYLRWAKDEVQAAEQAKRKESQG